MTTGHASWIGLGSLEIFWVFYWVNILSKQIGLDPENSLINADVYKRLPQYLKLEGGPILFLSLFLFMTVLLVSLILFMFRWYGVMCCGFTCSEAVGLVCNFSGKLLLGAFLDTSSSFFYSRLAWRYLMKNFSRYIVVINIYVLCCVSWRTEAVNFI